MMGNVLITGGTGFFGSHLIYNLLGNNYKVFLLKRSTSNTWRINEILDKIYYYDIDHDGIESAFKDQHINVVIHMACCYGRNDEKLSQIINTNILFGIQVLEAAIRFNVESFFNTDTFFNTDVILQNYLNSYSLSKRQFLEWLKQETGKIRIVNMKLQHIYGPKDDTAKFIPWILEQLIQNKNHVDLTNGEQERDFVYVSDVVSAYAKVLEQRNLLPQFAEFDVGTGRPVTVRQFVTEIVRQYKAIYPNNKTELSWGSVPYREGELMKVSVDINPLISLNWKPEYSYQEGINHIIPTRKSEV